MARPQDLREDGDGGGGGGGGGCREGDDDVCTCTRQQRRLLDSLGRSRRRLAVEYSLKQKQKRFTARRLKESKNLKTLNLIEH